MPPKKFRKLSTTEDDRSAARLKAQQWRDEKKKEEDEYKDMKKLALKERRASMSQGVFPVSANQFVNQFVS
jgi:hypothetical protein